MCSIYIGTKEKLRETLLNQKDRGLDSLGIVSNKRTHRLVRSKYKGYKKYIRNMVNDDWLLIMHHRKATIGAITPDNAHPFEGKYFQLMQNGTATNFHSGYADVYKKDTDTENLLHYIEDRTSNLEDVPEILEQLSSRMLEDLGIVIIVDKYSKQILFYADWARESYLDLDFIHMKVNGIYNYKPGESEWYENIGYIIFDFDFNIIRNKFNRLNKDKFYLYYSGGNSLSRQNQKSLPSRSSYYYSDYNWYYEGDEYNNYKTKQRETERDFAKAFGLDIIEWDIEREKTKLDLTTEELVEYDDVLSFLSDEWANMNDTSKNSAFKDYMLYNYWVDTAEAHKLYFDTEIRMELVFSLAYKEAFDF